MREADLHRLRTEMQQAGVAGKHVRRCLMELQDHYEDLVEEAIANGLSHTKACAVAADKLGSVDRLAQEYRRRTELRGWIYRYPRIARIVLPITYIVVLPLVPLFAGVAHASAIARWSTCLMLSALVTALMLLAMQLSIVMT